MSLLLTNIKQLVGVWDTAPKALVGNEMSKLPVIENAFLHIEEGKIHAYGTMEDMPFLSSGETRDMSGRVVLPGYIDSHTHLVFGDTRENEFVDRINGLTYEEIANRGGGILNSVARLRAKSEDELFEAAEQRLRQVLATGTTAIEIKSGYGLDLENELKMLRVVKRLKFEYNLPIKATLLAAHAVPNEYKGDSDGYLDYIINEIVPAAVKEELVDFVDIFCESGYFTATQLEKMILAGKQYNLPAKVHVNQFNAIGGIPVACALNALSVDHLEVMHQADYEVLKRHETMPVALPGCSFFLGIPYTPARHILDAQLPLAIATDYNPGSTPSGDMNFAVSLACIRMKMTPEEAINAATINAAYAMGLQDTHGTITVGKQANILITKPINSYNYLPYSFSENCIDDVLINGESWNS